ncbi:hypothetical protein KUTeg_001431 [Tegillarca granosa]|uniref:SAM-dependent MTase RsmB/NOP-type domain-containing protein n=1 Tax=Tegillarca granosa TaxID=220873 RepID=A0ABQ9FRE5_TEGGR|nr:hypothetical protein KUTeg_001431 [Tegillarca granosa]
MSDTKFSDILQEIVDSTDILNRERLLKNDRYLAQTLVYDSVFGKGLFRAGKLKQTMTRHKADINTECDRLKCNAGVQDLLDLVSSENGHIDKEVDSIPRYVRVNTLKTTTECVIQEFESDGWEQLTYSQDYDSFIGCIGRLGDGQFMKDLHIPDLLVFPPGTDLHDNKFCESGEIILQDKASCFPAFILSPPEGACVIDCCAAPGNKTSHLASIMQNKGCVFISVKNVYILIREKFLLLTKVKRGMKVLKELINKAGVTCVETFRQNFCMADPEDECFSDVEYILVDPSCSGSGIVGRMNHVTDDDSSSSKDRLQNLAAFQTSILIHALSFPNVKKVVYSTCSVLEEENEEVVEKVMSEMHEKFKVKKVVPDWPDRGHECFEHASKCLRMSSEKALTNGFFVACFKRRKEKLESVETNEKSGKRKCENNDDKNTKETKVDS